jgi:TolB-like protein/tetratricopeptide (TPR) repeat protein
VRHEATVAVLPFRNLSSDEEQEYFADGLTEETIAALGRVSPSRIRVIARTSVMRYKRTLKPAKQIGAELGASYLVETSVRRDAQQVRVTSLLIRVKDQVQVWNVILDRTAGGSLGVQDEIGSTLARQIGTELSSTVSEPVTWRATQNPDAHDLYLRGRYYLNQRAPEFLRKAMQCFEGAVGKDSSYALAFSGVAEAHVLQTLITGLNALDQWHRVRVATDTALGLDPSLTEGHAAAGMANFFMGWDWPAAERSFQRAIELNPNYAVAHQFYGHLLSNWRRHDEALIEIEKARELDPLSPMMHTLAGQFLLMAGRYDEALGPLQQALAIDPDLFPTHSVLGWLYDQTNRPDAALEEFRSAYRLSGNVHQLAYQGVVLGRIGRRAEALQIITTMSQISQSRFVPPFGFALVHAALGDREAAFQWLEKAYDVRDIGLVFLPVDPKWDSLRSDERFQSLVRRCGFPV